MNRLTARQVETLKKPGRHGDGGGLYLQIDPTGAKRWVFIYQREGRRREMGIGPLAGFTLQEARDARDQARRQLVRGEDPIEARKKSTREIPAFKDYAAVVVAKLPLTSEKYRKAWLRTLTDLLPDMQDMAVNKIGVPEVLKGLRPHWRRIPETAERLRGRIERVLDEARAEGLIDPPWENPARWKGHIEILLPKPPRATRHHAAMPYEQMGDFMADLRERKGSAPLALQWTILTAGRTAQTRFATWGEIDLAQNLWVIPAARMKMKRDHRVPLTDEMIAVLDQCRHPDGVEADQLIFPGPDFETPLSDGGMERVLDRMGFKGKATVHGFRSTFSDWAHDCTDHPREVIEAALAHLFGDETERAYRRGDALEKRRKLMEAWCVFCGHKWSENVSQLPKGEGAAA